METTIGDDIGTTIGSIPPFPTKHQAVAAVPDQSGLDLRCLPHSEGKMPIVPAYIPSP